MNKIFFSCLIVLISGCASTTPRQLRESPAGVYSFKVNADYKTVYEKALLHARSCYALGTTDNTFIVRGNESPENRKSSISIARVRALYKETLFTIDVAQVDEVSTEVNVYYAQLRYKTAAMTVEKWIKQDSNECNMSSVVTECVCSLDNPR